MILRYFITLGYIFFKMACFLFLVEEKDCYNINEGVPLASLRVGLNLPSLLLGGI